MKKWVWFFLMVYLSAGCAALRINPKGCKTNALWGSNPLSSREITREEVEDSRKEITGKKKLTVVTDTDIRLRDLLEENGIKCSEVKKIRVQISTRWIFFREIDLKVIKI